MLRTLKKWFGGRYSRTVASRRSAQPRRARLGVECLEARELLSTTAPGLSLSNGNLYSTMAAQTQLIDTGVQTFTVVHNKVFDLHTDGKLERLSPDGSGKVAVTSGAAGGGGGRAGRGTGRCAWGSARRDWSPP
jgi:hypothetical protein